MMVLVVAVVCFLLGVAVGQRKWMTVRLYEVDVHKVDALEAGKRAQAEREAPTRRGMLEPPAPWP